jgi:hypothetical protein
MKWTVALAALALLMASGCKSDEYADNDLCGQGQLITFDGANHCVYPSNLIVEGFLCPEDVPQRHDFEGEVVCTDSEGEDLSDEAAEKIREEGYDLDPVDGVNPGDTCEVEGDTAPAADGCNTCVCDQHRWSCTEIACPELCEEGDTRDAGDGCNTCVCDAEGNWACTEIACPELCEEGDTREAGDGCNTCVCDAEGNWACTEQACACADLDVDACAGNDSCTTIDGIVAIDDGRGGLCIPEALVATPLGCMDAGRGCGDAETYAAPAEDPTACVLFPSTCIPQGWSTCDEGPNFCRNEVTCEERSVDTCGEDANCGPVVGRPLHRGGDDALCVDRQSEETPYACALADRLCDDAITLAAPPEDPDNCVVFSNGCYPAAWSTDSCADLVYGECSDGIACSNLDVESCAADERCVTIDGLALSDDGQGGLCYEAGDEPSAQGCMAADALCGDFPTSARPVDDPNGCYSFLDTCIPSDWTVRGCQGQVSECRQ